MIVYAVTELISYQHYAMKEARERVLQLGAPTLSSSELLALAIGTPHSTAPFRVVEQLLSVCKDIHSLSRVSITDLVQVEGIGIAKAIQLKATVELGHRLAIPYPLNKQLIRTPSELASILIPRIGPLEQEEVHSVSLDSRNRVISDDMIYKGTISSANMRIGEIFRQAIRNNAASIVIAHNHPSGDSSPSQDDIQATKEVVKAGRILGIETLDHLVIGGNTYVSLKERGFGFE